MSKFKTEFKLNSNGDVKVIQENTDMQLLSMVVLTRAELENMLILINKNEN